MQENAHKYGFILRYPKDKEDITEIIYEPWHYRYVGKEHAETIMSNGLCLEEYVAFLKGYSYQNRLSVRTDAGDYEIYSVSLSENVSTKVPVPENGEYVISGDNQSMVIIAVPKA